MAIKEKGRMEEGKMKTKQTLKGRKRKQKRGKEQNTKFWVFASEQECGTAVVHRLQKYLFFCKRVFHSRVNRVNWVNPVNRVNQVNGQL